MEMYIVKCQLDYVTVVDRTWCRKSVRRDYLFTFSNPILNAKASSLLFWKQSTQNTD